MSYQGIADFRSDTVTRPTDEMRRAMFEAEVGDDVHGDDPTVNRLEELAADKLGMEAALFVPSGTMGNTIAVTLAAGDGKEVILEEKCHIYNFEAGNVSRIAGSLPRTLPSNRGEIPLDLVRQNVHKALREHMPETKVIALENTHNLWGGAVLSRDYLRQMGSFARENGLHLHLDGARVFNAAVARQVDVKTIVEHFDSVMFCLSKGLSAPVGSMLLGSREFIKEARFIRKYLGGGMRQVGIIAAAGIVSLERMVERLADDHIRAKRLVENLADIDGVEVHPHEVETNFVILRPRTMDINLFLEKLKEKKVLALPFPPDLVRFCTHKDIDDRDIDTATLAIRDIAGN